MSELDQSSLVSLRMGHLSMIESVIARLSGHSATVKNLCVTVYLAVFALAASSHNASLLWVAVIAPALFAMLDAYYLGVERSFRDFYSQVAKRALSEAGNVAMEQGKAKPIVAFFRPAVWPFYALQSALSLTVILKGLQ